MSKGTGTKPMVILGGGTAGGTAAAPLRDEGFGGRVEIIRREPGIPFGRPPLSKTYLRSEEDLASARDLFGNRGEFVFGPGQVLNGEGQEKRQHYLSLSPVGSLGRLDLKIREAAAAARLAAQLLEPPQNDVVAVVPADVVLVVLHEREPVQRVGHLRVRAKLPAGVVSERDSPAAAGRREPHRREARTSGRTRPCRLRSRDARDSARRR